MARTTPWESPWPRRARSSTSAALVVLLLVAAFIATACGGDGDADDHDVPGVYVAVIRSLAPGAASLMPKVVYVEALPGTKLSLQDQAAVVKVFDGLTTVRFVDDRTEAVDADQPQARVRRDGVLLRMSAAETTERGVSVKTTRYVAHDDEHTVCLDLEDADGTWSVTSSRAC